MNIEQAIESINIGMINYHEHGGWRFSCINHVALDVALAALRAQQERENPKPLTLEKLKQINKEPLKHWVWIEIIDGNVESGWRITHADYTNGETFCCGYPGISWSFKYSEYGKTWAAYDHEPKGGATKMNDRLEEIKERFYKRTGWPMSL